MSINLLDMVKGAVSDQVMGQIGSLLGQSDTKKTSSMFDTAVGTILGGLTKKAGTSQGAQDIFGAVQKQDDGLMDKLGDLLGGGNHAALEKSGTGILDMVFGGNRGGMIGAVSKFLGLDDSMMGKLLTLAAPIVMGVIGKHVKSKALDAVGLGSLLGEQKSFLSSSMPSQLTGALGFGDMLGGATDALKGAGSAITGAAGDAGQAAMGVAGDAGKAAMGAAGDAGKAAMGAAGDVAGAGGSMMKFLLPLILLGALGFLGYTIFSGGLGLGENVPNVSDVIDGEAMPSLSAPEMPDLTNMDFGDFDMSGMQEKFTGITDGFQNVTAESAQGLAGKITDLTGSIDGMGLDNLTGPAKSAAGGVIGKFVETIQGALGGISDDGIMGMLKPAVESLIEKLNAFT